VTKGRDVFNEIVATLDYPMYVLTVAAGDERSGCLVGFATQCSIDPPRFLVCVSKANHTFRLAERTPVFVVHVLRERDCDLAHLFGEATGDQVDKFARCEWRDGPAGVPVLSGCDWFAGPALERVDGGDHVGFVIDIADAARGTDRDAPQLGFQAVRGLDPGHPA
jgi:flavin reductase (DIM6/NTAB) family NADH-FMN oxidoreductase RutF